MFPVNLRAAAAAAAAAVAAASIGKANKCLRLCCIIVELIFLLFTVPSLYPIS